MSPIPSGFVTALPALEGYLAGAAGGPRSLFQSRGLALERASVGQTEQVGAGRKKKSCGEIRPFSHTFYLAGSIVAPSAHPGAFALSDSGTPLSKHLVSLDGSLPTSAFGNSLSF